MKARDIMTTNPGWCTPETSAKDAAKMMADYDCGCLPVVESDNVPKLIGVVTDRDITLRGVARGATPDVPVEQLMSTDVSCCFADSDLSEVEQIMAERQVRRVPVLDDDGCCIGMISQADLALEQGRLVSEQEVGRVLEQISQKINQPRSDADVGLRV